MRLDSYESGGVIENGALKLRNRERFEAAMRQMPEGEVLVTIRPARATRSAAQNRLYFKYYVAPLSEYTGYSPLAIHSFLKSKLLAPHVLTIANPDGEVIDEATIEPTTTTLTKDEFSSYLLQIADFAETLNVHVGPPIHDPAFSYE